MCVLDMTLNKLSHNATEATKNICGAKDEGAVDHYTVTRWFKKFHLDCNNLNDQVRSGKPKSMDSKVVLQAIEANPENRIGRVSGELSITHSSVVCHLHNLSKSIQSCGIVPHIAKILQNFWLTQVFSLIFLIFLYFSFLLKLKW